MLKRYLPLIALLVVVIACSKDKLETKPSIKITNYNAKALPKNADFLITLEFGDKDGDLGGGVLTYLRDRQNVLPVNPINEQTDSASYTLPLFPKNQRGEIQLKISASYLDERPGKDSLNPDKNNDTVIFKIIVKDRAGNVSDTVNTDPLVQLEDR